MGMSPKLLRPRQTGGFDPRSISGLALWLDAADSQTLYTTDAGPVTAVSSPLDIAGCALWLDGADSSDASMTLSGTNVSAWRDKSGNGRDFTSTGTARPTLTSAAINGRSALSFDGVDDRLSTSAFISSGTSGMTVFVVARGTFPGSGSFLFTHRSASGGVDSNDLAIGWSANQGSSWSFGTLRSRVTSFRSSVSYTADRRFDSVDVSGVGVSTVTASFGATSSSNSHRWQGSEASSTSGTSDGGTLAGMAIGHRLNATPDLFYTGAIAEVIVYNRVLTASDRARVEAYLAAKWGISGVHAPATATNDPVGAWLDKSGNGRHATQATGAARPIASLSAVNSRNVVTVDSSSKRLSLSSNVPTGSGASLFMVVQRTANNDVGIHSFGGASATSNHHPFAAIYYDSFASTTRQQWTQSYTSNLHLYGIVADASWRAFFNGANVYTLASHSLSAQAAGRTAWIGSGETSANAAQGRYCEVIAFSAALTASQRRRVEEYLARKWGITLAPQVSNADAQDWINRVYANGGTVSAATANAVNTFCNSIDAAGIRDRFYRLNLFAGNSDASLNAVRTPLYRGPSLGGTQYGSATDTNVNFVQGDYAETGASGGLKGDGLSKWLNTGVAANALTASNSHMGFGLLTTQTGAVSYRTLGGAYDGASNSFEMAVRRNDSLENCFFTRPFTVSDRAGVATLSTSLAAGNVLMAYPSFYRNGVQTGAIATTSQNYPAAHDIFIFALNTSNNGNPINRTDARLSWYSIGLTMTPAQVALFNSATAVLNAAMGRTT